MSFRYFLPMIAAGFGWAQSQPQATSQPPNDPDQQELMQALTDANSSTVDLVRILEAFLEKHPQTAQRKEIEKVLAKSAIENKDDRRTVLYDERVLAATPD